MSNMNQTELSAMKVRDGFISEQGNSHTIEWQDVPNQPRGESLLKNFGVTAALVLCAVTLRTGAIPPLTDATDAILTAATDHSLLDEPLGKLSFVSALFPETVLVFGEQDEPELCLPVSSGTIVHAWSEGEPYIMMRSAAQDVVSASAGEVIGIYHGNGDEKIVQVAYDDGFTCMYGNLEDVSVLTGDHIQAGAVLGSLLPDEDLVFEVRKNGFSVDPTRYLPR